MARGGLRGMLVIVSLQTYHPSACAWVFGPRSARRSGRPVPPHQPDMGIGWRRGIWAFVDADSSVFGGYSGRMLRNPQPLKKSWAAVGCPNILNSGYSHRPRPVGSGFPGDDIRHIRPFVKLRDWDI